MLAWNKVVSFQLRQSNPLPQLLPRTEMLLEQLIQPWDHDCRGPQSGKRLKEYQCKPCHQIPHQNPNHGITTMTILNAPQAMTNSALLSINPQVFGARLTNPKRTTLKIVFGSNGKMLSE
uniref:Uncharacterized protein n=1 Tax=Romanomermis culicivorax TaxID=13658 RepID=A0A915L0W2_ROMCU